MRPLLCCLAALLSLHTVFAAEPFIEKSDLFTAGDGGYKIFHIPGIVVTAKGTVLAWCEARKKGGDWDQIEIVLRRSTDEGKTWSKMKSIANVPGPNNEKSLFPESERRGSQLRDLQ